MTIFSITLEEAQALSEFFSPESFKNIGTDGYCTLGALDDEDFVCGVLQFFIDQDEEGDFVAKPEYIFVPEDFRGDGVGTALMYEYMNVLAESRIKKGLIELPRDKQDELEGFFMNFGFLFDEDEFPVYTLPVSACTENKAFDGISVEGCRSISYLEEEGFLRLQEEVKIDAKVPEKDGYDEESSCFYDEDGKKGLLLAKKKGSSLEVSFLGCNSKAPQKRLLSLVLYGARKAEQMYGPDMPIRLACRSSFTKELMHRVCSDAEPVKCITGRMLVK
jgi:GNAT superfamily N-acetyltransferase